MSITGYYCKLLLDTESFDSIGDSPIYLLLCYLRWIDLIESLPLRT